MVHEYDKERRERMEGRLEALKGERDDLRTVRARLVADIDDLWRRSIGSEDWLIDVDAS